MSCFRIRVSQMKNNMSHLESIYISLHNFTKTFLMRLILALLKCFLSSLKAGRFYIKLLDLASTSIMLKIIKQNKIFSQQFIAFSTINFLTTMSFTTTIFNKIINFNYNIMEDISFLNAINLFIC
jgi:hypothetical protein